MINLLQPVEVVRNPKSSGAWTHPVFSQYYNDTFGDIEHPTQEQWDGLLKHFGVEIEKMSMEDDEHVPHEVFKRIYDEGDPDAIADWNPTAPEGKGWFLIAINDTEDGPAAWFARSLQDQISDLQTDKLKAEIEEFKKECLQLWFCERLAASYTNIDLFECVMLPSGDVLFLREQARQLWSFWQASRDKAEFYDDYSAMISAAQEGE